MEQVPQGFQNISTSDLKTLSNLPQPYVTHEGDTMGGFIQVPTKRGDVRVPVNYDILSQVPGGVISFMSAEGVQHTVGWLPQDGKVALKVGEQTVGYDAEGMFLVKSQDGSIRMEMEQPQMAPEVNPSDVGSAEQYLPEPEDTGETFSAPEVGPNAPPPPDASPNEGQQYGQ